MTGIDPSSWSCPAPIGRRSTVVMGHGGGGRLSAELVAEVFLPAFANPGLDQLADSAVMPFAGGRLAMSTDSYVVRPLFFPGGNIGDLAVNGTVNDLAMSGARPLYLSAAFVLEEGLDIGTLGLIAGSMGAAAQAAGAQLITGDTKVVDQGRGDGVYITTAGVGLVPDGVEVSPSGARPGDVVIVSGTIGSHGVAILSVREGLEFGTVVETDSAPLNGLVDAMLAVAPAGVHALRDPTRGGLAATVNEIAGASAVGVVLEERSIPVSPEVAAACGFLGLDPLEVANEGRLVAFVAPEVADDVLAVMRDLAVASGAAVVGRVVADHPGVVVARTGIGGTRIVDVPLGEQLPRIC